ncbi:4Fe-4S binding protein [Methanosarcina barkeri]
MIRYRRGKIIVVQDRCTGCNICVKICPSYFIEPADEAYLL